MGVTLCPCGSAKPLNDCCGRYHAGEPAPTAEALMRSRYSAYVLKLSGYLRETWHPSTRPPGLDVSEDEVVWQRLQVIASGAGWVEFAAFYAGGQLHERSRFVQEDGRWFYLDGEMLPPITAEKPGRNTPCPCGSGKKYKRCCGQ